MKKASTAEQKTAKMRVLCVRIILTVSTESVRTTVRKRLENVGDPGMENLPKTVSENVKKTMSNSGIMIAYVLRRSRSEPPPLGEPEMGV